MKTRTWFITGTSSGLGRIMTEQLLERGDRVAATLRKVHVVDDLKTKYGEHLWVSALDVRDTFAVRKVVDRAFAAFGRIDVIVNNAGYGLFGASEEVSDDQIRDQIETNLIGSIQIIRGALPHLRSQGGGRILQVSSEGGQATYPNFSLYHATKWGIEGFVETVAKEVAPFGIEFTIIEPGPTRTDFGKGLVAPKPMDIYENTPAGQVRRAFTEGKFDVKGDAAKTVAAMIESVNRSPAPKRLALGSSAYVSIHAALTERCPRWRLKKILRICRHVNLKTFPENN
jgi:NAD(P)-dependent dehydrogenase (short-subunit alcohol dehydrogenase family)